MTSTVKWTYCKFSNLKRTEEDLKSGAIPPAPAFDPAMKSGDLKPGIVFDVTVGAHPR